MWELSPPLLASQCVSEQLTGPSTLWLDSDRYDPRRLQCGRGRGNETVSQWLDRRQAGESTCCPQLRGRVDAGDRIDNTAACGGADSGTTTKPGALLEDGGVSDGAQQLPLGKEEGSSDSEDNFLHPTARIKIFKLIKKKKKLGEVHTAFQSAYVGT